METETVEPTLENLEAIPFWAEFVEPVQRDQALAASEPTVYCDYDEYDGDVLSRD